MSLFFHPKHELASRSYDLRGSEFSALQLGKKNQNSENQKFTWQKSLVKDLAAIFASIFISAIGYGMLMVLIAFKLESNVKNEVLMSISTATQIGAGVIFSRFLPKIGRKIGMIKSIYLGSVISFICALILYFYLGYLFWLLVIFFIGTSFFVCGVTRCTIMIELSPPNMRAIIISIGGMLVAFGNSLGPIIITVLKTSDNFSSFALAGLFFLLSMLPLGRLKKIDNVVREEKKISTWRYIKNSPKIMLAGFCVSFATSSASAFLIIYGIKIGMPKDQASLLLSVLLFGTIFSVPIGYLTDILNRRLMMIFCSFIALVFAILLSENKDPQKIYHLLFFMFGALAGMKLPAILLINEKYKSTQRLAVNSAFSRFSLTGNICGLFATGFLMKIFGSQGLWISLIAILTSFLFFCAFNYAKKIAKKELKLQDFSIFYKKPNEPIN